MLFKFTSSDIQNTSIIDCATGAVIYEVSTPRSCTRSRSRSTASLKSFASFGSYSQEKLAPEPKITSILDEEGKVVANITWEDRHASVIRIGEETLAGTAELFDAAFVKVLPDETLIPTRMEYTWRTTHDSLTLLDDDEEEVGRFYEDCLSEDFIPAHIPGTGCNYLELDPRAPDELLELIVSYLLIHTLRERLYAIAKYVYGSHRQESLPLLQTPMSRLRRQASMSFANLRNSLRRVVS